MGKWDKYKKDKDDNKEEKNTSKTNINWVMVIYENYLKTLDI